MGARLPFPLTTTRPWLLPAERNKYELFPVCVYWPALDADIGVEGLLLGAKEHPAYAEKAVLRAQRGDIAVL